MIWFYLINAAPVDFVAFFFASSVKADGGVVARDPAVTLGVRSPETSPIAYSGRVYVKADTAVVLQGGGPIFPGDVLIASFEPGYAMRGGQGSELPNRIIGKALQSLVWGRGEILMLLD